MQLICTLYPCMPPNQVRLRYVHRAFLWLPSDPTVASDALAIQIGLPLRSGWTHLLSGGRLAGFAGAKQKGPASLAGCRPFFIPTSKRGINSPVRKFSSGMIHQVGRTRTAWNQHACEGTRQDGAGSRKRRSAHLGLVEGFVRKCPPPELFGRTTRSHVGPEEPGRHKSGVHASNRQSAAPTISRSIFIARPCDLHGQLAPLLASADSRANEFLDGVVYLPSLAELWTIL